jgi:hypothetical protein
VSETGPELSVEVRCDYGGDDGAEEMRPYVDGFVVEVRDASGRFDV